MRKFLSVFIAAMVLFSIFLTGCGGDNDPADSNSQDAATQQITPEQRQRWQEQGRDPYPIDQVNPDGTRG